MNRSNFLTSLVSSRTISIYTAALIIVLVILDLLATRQILYFDNTSEIILFTLTVVIGYGLGSWILLEYTRQITANLRSKSLLVNTMHWTVTIIQFSLLGILLFVLYNNNINCPDYFSKCTNVRTQTTLVYIISSIAASIIMGIISFKFFSWYKLNKRNFMVLFFGLAAATSAIAITEDAYTKLIFVSVVEEKSPLGAIPQASFIYLNSEKYHGEIQYKVVNPDTTTLWILPSSLVLLKNSLDYLAALPYVFTWMAVATLLRKYHKSLGLEKFSLKFWIILAIPLVLYLIGSGLIISLPADIPYRFYFRLLFRAGTIGSSALFGLAFFIVARNLSAAKVKDYLIISAMGIIMIGIANEISALQQTYGVAAHSLVLLASYLFSIGLYSSATSVSQDNSLRQSIRKSAIEASKLIDVLGVARLEQEIERRALNTAKEQQSVLLKQTGIEPSLTEHDMKQYLGSVLKEIKVLKNIDEILRKGKDLLESSYEFLICSRISGLRLVYNNYFDLYEKIMNKYKQGEHKGIKLLTTIADKDAADIVKKFLKIGVQIKHVNNMPPIDFALSDKEIIATTEKTAGSEEIIKSLLVSNEQAYISHFNFIFNELWRDAIDARERILSIEQGIEPEFFEVINDPEKANQILVDLAKSVKKEGLLLLPNDKAIIRQDRLGVVDYLINVSQQKNGAIIKIICPLSEENVGVAKKISEHAPNIKILNGKVIPHGMFIVDSEKFFRAELREPQAETFSEAIGIGVYSNSKRSVESFKSFFELLWNERILNEELKNMETMQQEFISTAAHELRNPIQPILGLSAILRSKAEGDIKQYRELLDVIYRSSKRLQQLTEDILDVAKIESQTLNLNKSQFNLKEVILNTIADIKTHLKSEGKDNKVKLDFIAKQQEGIFLYGDPARITQVISNILSNAIKFTDEGVITVKMKRYGEDNNATNNNNNQQVVMVSVQDTGKGIDPTVKDRLFEKFATKSEKGLGLGLYISKKIIEAHGGKIWAENNADGKKGSTFYFTLPVTNQQVNVKAVDHQ
jgi:signal transduction histidine kinase